MTDKRAQLIGPQHLGRAFNRTAVVASRWRLVKYIQLCPLFLNFRSKTLFNFFVSPVITF